MALCGSGVPVWALQDLLAKERARDPRARSQLCPGRAEPLGSKQETEARFVRGSRLTERVLGGLCPGFGDMVFLLIGVTAVGCSSFSSAWQGCGDAVGRVRGAARCPALRCSLSAGPGLARPG